MVCTFFGHRDCYRLDREVLRGAIQELIAQGADSFLVGHQGQFDSMVLSCLRSLKREFPHISYSVVLAYLPTQRPELDGYSDCGIYPEGLELGPPRFAIDRRNRWMLRRADCCLCWVDRTWGGAYKYARLAMARGLAVINLGSAKL